MKECLKKRGLDVRQARSMVHDSSVWLGFVRENTWALPWEGTIDNDMMPDAKFNQETVTNGKEM